jgi:hypothetical protein
VKDRDPAERRTLEWAAMHDDGLSDQPPAASAYRVSDLVTRDAELGELRSTEHTVLSRRDDVSLLGP